jgi:hypothetical protein
MKYSRKRGGRRRTKPSKRMPMKRTYKRKNFRNKRQSFISRVANISMPKYTFINKAYPSGPITVGNAA